MKQWYFKHFDELTNQELYDLLKIRQDIFVLEQQCIYPELDNEDQKAVHIFLKVDGEIAANVRVFKSGEHYDEASIGRVAVVEKFRRHGYGREIMEVAISYLEENDTEKKIKIQAQQYLHAFYGSLGFKQISKAYLDDGIMHIDMLRER